MSTDLDTISLLRDSLQRYGTEQYGMLRRAPRLALPGGFCRDTWRQYSEFGWLGVCLPESLDGLDSDAVAVGTVMEMVGSRLLLEPLLAHAVLAVQLLRQQGSAQQQAELLPAMGQGQLLVVPTLGAADLEAVFMRDQRLNGEQVAVLHGDVADQFLIPAHDDRGHLHFYLVAATAQGVERQVYRLVDGRGAATLRLRDVEATRLVPEPGAPSADATLAHVGDLACAALCAEVQGIGSSLLRSCTEYLKVRQQFGKPLGANQALQHRMADLYLLSEEIRALTHAVQTALGEGAGQHACLLHGARAYIIEAGRRMGNEAIQLHGGVGITEELDVSHYFRRLLVNAALFGNADQHVARFTELTLKEPEHA